MLSRILICQLSDILVSRVNFGNTVSGRLIRKCPGIEASPSLTTLDGVTSDFKLRMASICVRTVKTEEIVVAFFQLFGRNVVSTISLPLPITLRKVALLLE